MVSPILCSIHTSDFLNKVEDHLDTLLQADKHFWEDKELDSSSEKAMQLYHTRWNIFVGGLPNINVNI